MIELIKRHYNSLMHQVYRIIPVEEVAIANLITEVPVAGFQIVVAIRYLFVEYYFEGDVVKLDLYNKLLNAGCHDGQDESTFKQLIQSIVTNGFKRDSAVYIDRNNNLIDGTHRLATSIYIGMKSIYARTIPRKLNPMSLSEKIKYFALSEADKAIVYNAYERMEAKLHEKC